MSPLSLSGPIIFSITPSRLDVRAGTVTFALEPVMYFAATAPKPKVLAVGNGRVPMEAYVRVDLFRPKSSLPPNTSKMEALDRFFRYVMKQIIDRHVFRTKPDIRVVGAESLEDVLGGYQVEVLSQALEGAGARRVTFLRAEQAGIA